VWAHVLVLDEHADGGAECHALFGSCTVPRPLGFWLYISNPLLRQPHQLLPRSRQISALRTRTRPRGRRMCTGEDLDGIVLVTARGDGPRPLLAGPPAVELYLDVLLCELHARRHAIDDASHAWHLDCPVRHPCAQAAEQEQQGRYKARQKQERNKSAGAAAQGGGLAGRGSGNHRRSGSRRTSSRGRGCQRSTFSLFRTWMSATCKFFQKKQIFGLESDTHGNRSSMGIGLRFFTYPSLFEPLRFRYNF